MILAVGELEGSCFDRSFQAAHLERRLLGHFPFCGKSVGELIDLDGVERLLQKQQAIACVESGQHFGPGVIGKGSAKTRSAASDPPATGAPPFRHHPIQAAIRISTNAMA